MSYAIKKGNYSDFVKSVQTEWESKFDLDLLRVGEYVEIKIPENTCTKSFASLVSGHMQYAKKKLSRNFRSKTANGNIYVFRVA